MDRQSFVCLPRGSRSAPAGGVVWGEGGEGDAPGLSRRDTRARAAARTDMSIRCERTLSGPIPPGEDGEFPTHEQLSKRRAANVFSSQLSATAAVMVVSEFRAVFAHSSCCIKQFHFSTSYALSSAEKKNMTLLAFSTTQFTQHYIQNGDLR